MAWDLSFPSKRRWTSLWATRWWFPHPRRWWECTLSAAPSCMMAPIVSKASRLARHHSSDLKAIYWPLSNTRSSVQQTLRQLVTWQTFSPKPYDELLKISSIFVLHFSGQFPHPLTSTERHRIVVAQVSQSFNTFFFINILQHFLASEMFFQKWNKVHYSYITWNNTLLKQYNESSWNNTLFKHLYFRPSERNNEESPQAQMKKLT